MTYWYLDYENAHSDACLNALLSQTRKGDTVIAFYSSATPDIRIKFLRKLETKGVKFKTHPCLNGAKNAMDFQIVMALAVNCVTTKTIAHRVVSKDYGYQVPLRAWRERGYDVGLCVPDELTGAATYPQ